MKKKVWFSLIIMILVLVLTFGMVSCNKKKKKNTTVKDTLVVGYDLFSNKFSPFFSETSYDQDVWSMTQIGLLAADRQGAIIYNGIEGETINYNGTNYTYYGLSNLTVTKVTEGADAVTFIMTLQLEVAIRQYTSAMDNLSQSMTFSSQCMFYQTQHMMEHQHSIHYQLRVCNHIVLT